MFENLRLRLEAVLHERSSGALSKFEALFRFGHLYVAHVPAGSRELVFRRDAPSEVGVTAPTGLINIPGVLADSSGIRWTVLTGQFGTGKTTGAMRSAASSTRPMLLVPCATVPATVFTEGATNRLSQHIVESLDLLPEPDSFQDLRRAAGAVLSYLLRRQDSPFVFILDGLDEHHVFSTLDGLQRLSNQLADFSCAIVITTRSEHLKTLLADFNVAFSQLGSKFGKRTVTCIELEHWNASQTRALVDLAVDDSTPNERPRLQEFRESLETGAAEAAFGDLLRHPLFLHFILEDITNEEFSARTRPELLRRWIARKLRRDRSVWVADTVAVRPTVRADIDTEGFIERMIAALEDLAFELASEVGSQMVLEESASDAQVRRTVARHFDAANVEALPVLLNSVLVVHSRSGSTLRVGFALRSLHEYLAAAHLVRKRLNPDSWPAGVREFAAEIRKAPTVSGQ